jgi:Lecithin retinol acyltransferase
LAILEIDAQFACSNLAVKPPLSAGSFKGALITMIQTQSEVDFRSTLRVSAWVGDISEQLIPGTHLIVCRRGYSHHGIYLGDGRVVHYAGRIKYPQGLIEEISVAEFSEGRAFRAEILQTGRFNGSEIVRRARSRLGERRYDLLRNNCEHFCNWCRLGENRSSQVECLTAPVRLFRNALLRLYSMYRSVGGTPATQEESAEHAI